MLFIIAIEKFIANMEMIDRSNETINVYGRDLYAFNAYMEEKKNGQIYLNEVTTQDIEDFLKMLKEEKEYSAHSRSRNMYTLRSLYSYLTKKDLVERNITLSMDPIKLPKKERNYLTEEEVAQLTATITNKLISLVVSFFFYTGVRSSECLNLKLSDVDMEKKVVHVYNGKGAKDRQIPINDKLYALLVDYLDNWRDAERSNLFFATQRTGSLSNSYLNATLRETTEKLGWKKKVSCHVLRHSFASALVKKKVGLVEISKLLGHSSLAITSIYYDKQVIM